MFSYLLLFLTHAVRQHRHMRASAKVAYKRSSPFLLLTVAVLVFLSATLVSTVIDAQRKGTASVTSTATNGWYTPGNTIITRISGTDPFNWWRGMRMRVNIGGSLRSFGGLADVSGRQSYRTSMDFRYTVRWVIATLTALVLGEIQYLEI